MTGTDSGKEIEEEKMNLLDVVLVIVLAAVIGAALYKCISVRKRGSCSCGCSSCPGNACCVKTGNRENGNRDGNTK